MCSNDDRLNDGIDDKGSSRARHGHIQKVQLITYLRGVYSFLIENVREIFLQQHYIPFKALSSMRGAQHHVSFGDVIDRALTQR